MKIYLVRHGESTFNAKNLHQDELAPLSKNGIKQAKEIAKRFKDVQIDTIIASPFTRAKETAGIINETINKKVSYSPLIIELKRPSSFTGKYYLSTEVVKIKKMISKNMHDPEWRYSDEETFFEFKQRAFEFQKEIEKNKKENILIVSHGDFIRIFVAVLIFKEKLTSDLYKKMRSSLYIENTGITECEFVNNKWRIISWNDLNHLK